MQVKIGDSEVEFSALGRMFRLQCASRLRSEREEAYKKAVSLLPSDPVSMMSRASAAIDAFASSVIVTDKEVNDWLATPDGFYHAFSCSLKKSNPEIKPDRIEALFDAMDEGTFSTLRDFWGDTLVDGMYADKLKAWDEYMKSQIDERLQTIGTGE